MRFFTIVALGLTPGLAAGQTTAAAPAPLPTRLPFEQYTPSLSIATPPGVMRRQETPWLTPRPWSEQQGPESRALQTAEASTPPVDLPVCPMPVARADTTSRIAMPVVTAPAPAASVGTIRGCENPLAVSR
jgi:hypothetical protein